MSSGFCLADNVVWDSRETINSSPPMAHVSIWVPVLVTWSVSGSNMMGVLAFLFSVAKRWVSVWLETWILGSGNLV